MGAHKHRLRTTCLAVALLFLTANQAVAHQTNAQTELQEGVASFYSDRFKGPPPPVASPSITKR